MALTQGLLNDYWRRYNQRRALTGLPSSYQEQRGMLDPIMEQAYQKDVREKELMYNNQERGRQLSLQEQQAKDQARAANISGATNLVGLGVQGYLGYKTLTKPTPTATMPTSAGAGSAGATAQPGVGSGTVPPPSTTNYPGAMSDAQMAYDTGGSPGAGAAAETGVGMGGASQYGAGYGAAAGLLAGAATNYLTTQTGEGKASNARVADWSKGVGMTSWSDEDYASKGSATVGGLAGGGAFGAAVSNVAWDVGKAFQTGKISNELLGIPYADKLFNTDLGSIFGW